MALHEAAPHVRVFAAEPAGADDAWRSKQRGERVPMVDPQTIADGLRTTLGDLSWPVLRDHVDAVLRVSEDEIVGSMRALFERAKLVVEPSGAVSLAAALGDEFRAETSLRRVAVVLSGGNVDPARAYELLSR